MTATLSSSPRILKTLFNFAVGTLVLAVEIDEPTTKKIRECGAKDTQLSLIFRNYSVVFNISNKLCEFFLYEKLIEKRGHYVLICKGNKSLIPLAY